MCGGGGSTPEVQQPAPIAPAPTAQSAQVVASRDNERARRRMASSNTILTGARGVLEDAPTQGKTLLGQ